MNAIIILILSISILCLIISLYFTLRKNKSLINKIEKMNNEVNCLYNFLPGGKVIVKDCKLRHKKTNTDFSVNYEVEILEESENKIKVKAYDYHSEHEIANNTNNTNIKQDIISFMNNKWIEKKECEVIFDNQQSRNLKLNKLLNND